MKRERRVYATEFRDVPGSNGRQKWATAVAYNVVDDYGTLWRPGVFDVALSQRMPTVLYGHDWGNLEHILGAGIDYRQTPSEVGPPGVDVLVEFADPEQVPAAGLAMNLLRPDATSRGSILRDVSVGFVREEWATRDKLTDGERTMGADEAMIAAGMDELSLVVRGAVPGAQMRGRRSAQVDIDSVVELVRRVNAGELSEAEARAAIDLLGVGAEIPATEGVQPVEAPAFEVPDMTADIDAALASIGRSAPRR